jgi:hypothetical protein
LTNYCQRMCCFRIQLSKSGHFVYYFHNITCKKIF